MNLRFAMLMASIVCLSGCTTGIVEDLTRVATEKASVPLVRICLVNDYPGNLGIRLTALDSTGEGQADVYTAEIPSGQMRWVDLAGNSYRISLWETKAESVEQLRRRTTFETKDFVVVRIPLASAWEVSQ